MNPTRHFGHRRSCPRCGSLGHCLRHDTQLTRRLSDALGGGSTDGTIAFIIVSIVMMVSGGFLTVFVKHM